MADSFSVFSLLPCELRIAIWKASFPTRTLHLTYWTGAGLPSFTTRGSQRTVTGFVIDPQERIVPDPLLDITAWDEELRAEPIEAILALQVCQESRRVALESGYKIWKQGLPLEEEPSSLPWRYWNPSYDTVYSSFYRPRQWQQKQIYWLLCPSGENRAFIERCNLADWYDVPEGCWGREGSSDGGRMVEIWRGDDDWQDMTVALDHAYESAICETKLPRRGRGPPTKVVLWANELIRDMRNTRVWPVPRGWDYLGHSSDSDGTGGSDRSA